MEIFFTDLEIAIILFALKNITYVTKSEIKDLFFLIDPPIKLLSTCLVIIKLIFSLKKITNKMLIFPCEVNVRVSYLYYFFLYNFL